MNQITRKVTYLGRQIAHGFRCSAERVLENRSIFYAPTLSSLMRQNTAKPRLISTSPCNFNETQETLPKEVDNEPDVLYQRLEVEVRGHDLAVLRSYERFACEAAKHLGIFVSRTWEPPKHLLRQDALKSVHIYKKHIVQYEFRTYFKVIEMKYLTGSTADTYLEYIQRNLPEGCAMKVTKDALEKLPEYIRPQK